MPRTFGLFLGVVGSQAKLGLFVGYIGIDPPAPAPVAHPAAPAPIPAAPAAPPVPVPAPAPPVAHPTAPAVPPAPEHLLTLSGKISTFGGPDDHGMAPDEGLALFEPGMADEIQGFLLPQQPPGTTGLGRRLNPGSHYIACRWDYHQTPKSYLRGVGVHVTAQGKTINCRPVDWGPNVNTGRIADLSPGAAAALGIHTDDTVTVTIPLPTGQAAGAGNLQGNLAGSSEPAWLTWARGELGQREDTDNTGPVVQKYIDLAHCGAQHDPWCSIFACAALEVSGVTSTRSALAHSFTTSPHFTKLDAPRAGALAVFWRGSPDSGLGHVGFYVGEDATHVKVLGGNENDEVEIESIPKAGSTMGLLGYWWPAAATAEPKMT